MKKNHTLLNELPLLTAGFVAVLVGFASSGVIVFQAARALGANTSQINSWILSLGLGMALTSIALSWRYRIPILTAWSTPGAVILMTVSTGTSLNEATGSFILASAMTALLAYSGWLERALKRLPASLAAAMLAGVLFRFGLQMMQAVEHSPALILCMAGVYLIVKRFHPRYAVIAALLAGMTATWALGLWVAVSWPALKIELVPIMPSWSWASVIGMALPLFIVTMASQNVPGVAVMRTQGYEPPITRSIGFIGLVNLALACFGAFALNLAAITAAICAGPEAHEDRQQRYRAAIYAGVFYGLVGLLSTGVVALFTAFPQALVVGIAGLALLGTIGNSLAMATEKIEHREAALITFLVTTSGISAWSIGSAFWGLVAGCVTLLVWHRKKV